MRSNFLIFLISILLSPAATRALPRDSSVDADDVSVEISLPEVADKESEDCESALLPEPAADSSARYYISRLPDSGGYRFDKVELNTLFGFRTRAAASPEKFTRVGTMAESRLLSIILRRPVRTGEEFTLSRINDHVLLAAFQRLAYKFARLKLIYHPDLDRDDLIQAAMLGLHNAILDYHENLPFMFSTVAFNHMKKEFNAYVLKEISPWSVSAPAYLYLRVLQLAATLRRDLGRAPTAAEVAGSFNSRFKKQLTERAVARILEGKVRNAATHTEYSSAGEAANLDSDLAVFQTITATDLAVDVTALTVDEYAERFHLARALADYVRLLPALNQSVLKLRFGFDLVKTGDGDWRLVPGTHDGKTLEEIADILHRTPDCIRQYEARAMRKFRRYVMSREDLPLPPAQERLLERLKSPPAPTPSGSEVSEWAYCRP